MLATRHEIIALLGGKRPPRLPVFGGLPSLTRTGLDAAGLTYASVHTDAERMARAAASTAEVFGYEAMVVPHDMCVEAEALGARVDFHDDSAGFSAPIVSGPLAIGNLPPRLHAPDELARAGRVPLVVDALRRLKAGPGQQLALAAWVPGPFTLGWAAYRAAGADYLTIHEMGGSPQVIGPRVFRARVKPALARLIAQLPKPVVLSVCGNTNAVVQDLAACGAQALNLDHLNDLARTRQQLGPAPILLGNFDPVGVLSQGAPELVTETVRGIAEAGADAVWPGCDLWPDIPPENFRALVEAARRERRP
jgi:[methyl-Co(III) methanol-specific corrinoid protein]:coenzyme M methyltransferase